MRRLAIGLTCVLVILACSSMAGATEYFICNQPGHGAGTLANPYRMGDLPDPTQLYDNGVALSALYAGDTLTFLGGDYTFNSFTRSMGGADRGYIHPIRSGTAEAPITFRAKPGETVRLIMLSGVQPVMGTIYSGGVASYIRFVGFYIDNREIYDGGEFSGIKISGNYNEVAYCQSKGIMQNDSDNYNGFRLEQSNHTWIHHCEALNWNNLTHKHNATGIQLYTSQNAVIEDNYFHDNDDGMFDKDSGFNNIYRRNYVTNNTSMAFHGNNQQAQALYTVTDNVLIGQIDIYQQSTGVTFNDNLIIDSYYSEKGYGFLFGTSGDGLLYQTSAWNNIVICSSANPSQLTAYYSAATPFSTTPPNNTFTYFDYNAYQATPLYNCGQYYPPYTIYSLAQIQGYGFELNSTVASKSAIFVDTVNYQVKAPYTTAGRYGDCLGPDNTLTILDTSRYGPAAIKVTPTAIDDSYSVFANHTLTVVAAGVLANDSGGTITAVKQSDPAHGGVTLNSDGSFTYTPTPGYAGSDSFTYVAHNANGDSNVATVTITVNLELAITLTSPNGGRVWTIGSSPAVTWTSAGSVGNVDIDLSTDSGATWATLVAGTANDGSQAVTVPNSYSKTCRVRVKQTSGGSPSDTSDANFTITCAGDVTCNGYVDGGDLNLLLANWNKSQATWSDGDVTGNNYIDGGDLNILLANWNVRVAVPPTAVADSYSVSANHTLTVAAAGVLANDTGLGTLTAVKLTDPSHGSLTLNSDGSFTYMPTTGYTGGDSFTYKARNSSGDSTAVTVSIAVNAPPAPTAVNDSYAVSVNGTLTVAASGVLANDTDSTGLPLTAIKVTDPSHGSVTLNSNGGFTYTPAAGYTGSDSFTYKANNGFVDSNIATVNINVTQPTRILIDCGSSLLSSSTNPAANSDGRYWNNFTAYSGSPAYITSCTTSTGGSSGIKLTRTANFYNPGQCNSVTGAINGWPLSAVKDGLVVINLASPGILEFSQLDASGATHYDLTVFGSLSDAGVSHYTVVASTTTSQEMETGWNLTQWKTFSNLTPDANGKITLKVGILASGARAAINVIDLSWNAITPAGSAGPVGSASHAPATGADSVAAMATTVSPANTASASANVASVTTAKSAPAFTAQVNFQPASAAAPEGYLIDSGKTFGKNANGYTYGWTKDLSAFAVQRNNAASQDSRYDTAVMLVAGGTWEMAVPNGMYDVKVVAGAGGNLIAQKFSVEGVPMTQAGSVAGWSEQSVTVVVTDSRLTIAGNPGSSLCFVQITGR